MSEVVVAGLRVNYEIVGEGPAILLLHGWGGCIGSMGPIQSSLAREYRVLTLDLPGFGLSQMPPEQWGSAEYARCVWQLLAELDVTEVLCVVGHSFGGKVAIHLALQQRGLVGALILVGTPGVRLPPSKRTRRRIATVKLVRRIAKALPQRPRHLVEKLLSRLGSEDYRNAGPMRDILVRVVNEDLRTDLSALDIPTLLIWGQFDDATPVEIGRVMEASIAGSGLVVLEQSGHFPYLDEPQAFSAIVGSFLRSMHSAEQQ